MSNFHRLPVDLFMLRTRLLLCGSTLRSNQQIVVASTKWQRKKFHFTQKLVELGVDEGIDKKSVKELM